MSVLESSNLRDLLRVRDNEDDGRDALAGLTLAAVLGCENNIRRPSRTLLDIIKDEESGAAYRGLTPPIDDGTSKTSWKSFKNRIRLRRAGTAFSASTSSNPVSACDFAVEDCNIRISPPILLDRRQSRNTTLASGRVSVSPPNGSVGQEAPANSVRPTNIAEEEEQEHVPTRGEMGLISTNSMSEQMTARAEELRAEEVPVGETGTQGPEIVSNLIGTPASIGEEATPVVAAEEAVAPPRVSLMALLEETEWSAGLVGSTEMETDEVNELEENSEHTIEEGAIEGGEYVCCVCMVRHKGAAFIPCGHTFCRLCSRELWVNRGNCPLCNGFILEILDIF